MSIFRTDAYDFVVWEKRLSELVREVYGRPDVSLRAWWEAGQGTFHAYDVTGDADEEWAGYAETHMGDWLAGNIAFPDSEALFWDMCRRGAVPAGRWLVEVWW